MQNIELTLLDGQTTKQNRHKHSSSSTEPVVQYVGEGDSAEKMILA